MGQCPFLCLFLFPVHIFSKLQQDFLLFLCSVMLVVTLLSFLNETDDKIATATLQYILKEK